VISREAIIGGEVRGSIRADERIEIQSTSVVHGDVVAKRLLVQEGGEITASCAWAKARSKRRPSRRAGAAVLLSGLDIHTLALPRVDCLSLYAVVL